MPRLRRGECRPARFCDQCGGPLATTGRRAATKPATEPGDRRIVTALFADIVDYSRLVSELDPEDVAARIEEAFGLMAGAVERYGGIVEKFIGDAVFALFGAAPPTTTMPCAPRCARSR